MTAQESLSPCPFCGGEAELDIDTGFKAVQCMQCFVVGEVSTDAGEAAAKWNRRAQPVARTPLSDAEVDDLWEGATGGHSFTEETRRTFVRAIEAAHGITQEKQG